MMKNNIILVLFICALVLIFVFQKASFKQFALGFGLCLLGEAILISFYCIFKMQNALLDSTRFKLEQNYSIVAEKMFPFKIKKENPKIFLNKFTEQEKLQSKKNTLKVQSFESYINEEEILSQEPKKQIFNYLNERKSEQKLLNAFNMLLIQFGQGLNKISFTDTKSFFNGKIKDLTKKQYSFEEIQIESQLSQNQLQNQERQVLDDLQIKIKIKKDEQKNIMLPSWSVVIQGFKHISVQFEKISQMHNSNKQIIQMINKKISEDFQYIETEIKKTLKSLNQIHQTSVDLKKQNQKFLSRQQQNIKDYDQNNLISILKQQYYKFQDFQLRIKENQKNYHIQNKKLSYFKQKLSTFHHKNKVKYQKIFKTRYYALLDSFNITVQESIKIFRKIFSTVTRKSDFVKPPKVSKMQIYKNMNEQIKAEFQYQSEYFDRAQFYMSKSNQFINSMVDMKKFIQKVKQIFIDLEKGLGICDRKIKQDNETYSKNSSTINVNFILKLHEVVAKLLYQLQHIDSINDKFLQKNETYLQQSCNLMSNLITESEVTLVELKDPKQFIQHKYKLVKMKLEEKYFLIENQIKQIKRFQPIYHKHSLRLKKIILMQLANFLLLKKKIINQSDFIRKNNHSGNLTNDSLGNSIPTQYNLEQIMTNTKDELPLNNIHQEEKQKDDIYNKNNSQEVQNPNHTSLQNVYTGQYLKDEFVKLINHFLFVAYNQWKNSQFFKQTLSKQLYILLNKQENENISQVIIENIQITGYPPEILSIKQLHSQNFEFLADISLNFKGKIIILLKTQYKLMGIQFPTQVKVQLEHLYCVIRICFVNTDKGQSWFSFIGQPIAKFNLHPKIYSIKISVETIRNFFSNLILKKLRQSIFPIRQKIMIPVSKQDVILQKIQKRFKKNYNFQY